MNSQTDVIVTIALVQIVGFSIQQGLQMLDPIISIVLSKFPGTLDFSTKKKLIMNALSLGIGYICASYFGINLLRFLLPGISHNLDVLLSSLALSAGTEGANSIQKYLGYVKDSQKSPQSEITIIPAMLTISTNKRIRLICVQSGTEDTRNTWEVLESDMGTLTADGVFTANATRGTCHVIARSSANPLKIASATIQIQ